MTAFTDLTRPHLVANNNHPDIRGSHKKLYGSVPENLHIPGFEVKEIFMTESHKNVLRGLHFQEGAPQAKIIKPITGSIQVNTVCLDPNSENFGEVIEWTLTEDNEERLYVPGLWGLGYRVLEDSTRVLYIADEHFVPNADTGIDPFDKELNLNWGAEFDLDIAIMSDRDKVLQSFADFKKRVK